MKFPIFEIIFLDTKFFSQHQSKTGTQTEGAMAELETKNESLELNEEVDNNETEKRYYTFRRMKGRSPLLIKFAADDKINKNPIPPSGEQEYPTNQASTKKPSECCTESV